MLTDVKTALAALMMGIGCFAGSPAVAGNDVSGGEVHGTAGEGMGYSHRTLPNGLEVYSIRDESSSSVSVQVWYKVGSLDDPEGRSGFAHMFEHMMFKASRNLPPGSFEQLTGEVGGDYNAVTEFVSTNYFTRVPARFLEGVLFAEADRMGSLVVDQASFESEREVVKEEMRSRTLGTPYGRFYAYHLPNFLFRDSPYRRTGIGSMEQLDAASLDELARFHRTFYRPDNAYLIVAGNFDPAQLDRWIDQYFGPVEKPLQPIPEPRIEESFGPGRSAIFYGPKVPEAMVQLSWPTIPYAHADRAPLSVIAAILSSGRSSRLYEALVRSGEVATTASAENFQTPHLGAFHVRAMVRTGTSTEKVEMRLRQEVARLVTSAVDDAELVEAKTELLADMARSKETATGRAYALGQKLVMGGDPARSGEDAKAIEAVTVADIQRVARRYLTEANAITSRFEQANKQHPETPLPAQVGGVLQLSDLAPSAQLIELAQPADRAPMPGPGTATPAAVPKIVGHRLPNGMRVIVAERPGTNLVSVRLDIAAGAAADPADKSGLAGLTAGMLSQGAGERTAVRVAQDIERLGAYLGAVAEEDLTRITSSTTSDRLPELLSMMADMAMRPQLDPSSMEREKNQAISRLEFLDSQPRDVAGFVSRLIGFERTPYAKRIYGSRTSLAAIDTEDARQFHQQNYAPDAATLILTGGISSEAGFVLADEIFGYWVRSASRTDVDNPSPGHPEVDNPPVIVIDMPGATQSAVMLAAPAVGSADPDYSPLLLANEVIGGGFASRLNQKIRIEKGLSYGAGSKLEGRSTAGMWSALAQTKNETAPDVAAIMLDEVRKLGREPVPDGELAARKASLVESFGRSLESGGSLAETISSLVSRGTTLDRIADYPASISAVDAGSLASVVRKYLGSDKVTLVIAGDAKVFGERLRKAHPAMLLLNQSDLAGDIGSLPEVLGPVGLDGGE